MCRRFVLLIVFALVGFVLIMRYVVPRLSPPSAVLRWQTVAPGMEIGEVRERVRSGPVQLTAMRIDPKVCDIRVVNALSEQGSIGALAEDACPPTGMAINASLFAPDHTPLGLVVIDGKQHYAHFPGRDGGVFQLRYGRPEIVPASRRTAPGVTQAVESKPQLLIDGRISSFKPNGPERRSAVALDAQGRVLFAVTGDGFLTLEEWAECLQRDFGAVDALNLDGGSSTQLSVRGQVNRTVHGALPVPILLTATPRK